MSGIIIVEVEGYFGGGVGKMDEIVAGGRNGGNFVEAMCLGRVVVSIGKIYIGR